VATQTESGKALQPADWLLLNGGQDISVQV
jgi:hypothetical protein